MAKAIRTVGRYPTRGIYPGPRYDSNSIIATLEVTQGQVVVSVSDGSCPDQWERLTFRLEDVLEEIRIVQAT